MRESNYFDAGMKLKEQILKACSAERIPEGASGLWHIKKLNLSKQLFVEKPNSGGKGETLPPGVWTSLFRYTESAMHTYGEMVMHDFPNEIHTHMIFMLKAKGNVLVSGLGLGCVARGLLANPSVSKVTVLENSTDVLKLVGIHMEKSDRLEIIFAEAEDWIKKNNQMEFDCAWHDLWTDTDKGEPHLQVKHATLLAELHGRVRFQGAWNFPRDQRRAWAALNII